MLHLVQSELDRLKGSGRELIGSDPSNEAIDRVIANQIVSNTVTDLQLSSFESQYLADGDEIPIGEKRKSQHVRKVVQFLKLVDCIELASITSKCSLPNDISLKKSRIDLLELYSLRREVENISAFLTPAVSILTRHLIDFETPDDQELYLSKIDGLKDQIANCLLDNKKYAFSASYSVSLNTHENQIEIYVPNSKYLSAELSELLSCEAKLISSISDELSDVTGLPVIVFDSFISEPLLNDFLESARLSKQVDLLAAISAGHILTKLFTPSISSTRSDTLTYSEIPLIEESLQQKHERFDLTHLYKKVGSSHVSALEAYYKEVKPLIQMMRDAPPSSYSEIIAATRLIDDALLEKVFDRSKLMDELVIRHDNEALQIMRMSCSRMLIALHNANHVNGDVFAPYLYLKDEHLENL